MHLLHVDSSVLGMNSASRALTADVVAAEVGRSPGTTVVYRDLATDPVGHLAPAHLAAAAAGVADQPDALRHDLAEGQAALEEFMAADVVVVGAPMYNFGVPSQLKAWVDRLCVAGKTFRYGDRGPEGLAGGRRVVIVSTRGGLYGPGSPRATFDHQEAWLKDVFGFLGVTDVSVVRAEGLAVAGKREPAMAAARAGDRGPCLAPPLRPPPLA